MVNVIIILIILAIIGGAVFYLYSSKKRGDTCIGCPYSKECGKHSCGDSGGNKKK